MDFWRLDMDSRCRKSMAAGLYVCRKTVCFPVKQVQHETTCWRFHKLLVVLSWWHTDHSVVPIVSGIRPGRMCQKYPSLWLVDPGSGDQSREGVQQQSKVASFQLPSNLKPNYVSLHSIPVLQEGHRFFSWDQSHYVWLLFVTGRRIGASAGPSCRDTIQFPDSHKIPVLKVCLDSCKHRSVWSHPSRGRSFCWIDLQVYPG